MTETEFVPYTAHDPVCAVATITPPDQAFMHTYYDVCPWSPSGRLIVCLRLPYEDREPAAEDAAELCVIDLDTRTIRAVATTTGWGFQTAAHQQWGRTDRYLYYNDKHTSGSATWPGNAAAAMPPPRAFGVRLDLHTGEKQTCDGPIWQVSPDETFAICPCLVRANLTQPGYGVSVAPTDQLANTTRAAEDDGLFRVDLRTGRQTMLISLEQCWQALADRDELADSVLYAFHAKFNPRGDRIMLVVRARRPDGRFVASLLAADANGANPHTVVSHRLWRRGGHHPIWHADGEHVLMNLTPEADMRLCLVHADTGELTLAATEPPGSGHPSASPDGRWLLTDETRESAIVGGQLTDSRGSVTSGRALGSAGTAARTACKLSPDNAGVRTATIRLVDLVEGPWRDLCTATSPAVGGSALRRDAHPVFDRRGRNILFLAAPVEGPPPHRRQLFVADPARPPGELPEGLR